MNFSSLWVARMTVVFDRITEFTWVVVIYLASELAIWGLSRVMAPLGIQFFASIIGMVFVFVIMISIYLWRRDCDGMYQRWIKSKVDFINSHMGVGFSIPIVMMDPHEVLGGQDIARIVGNFVITNLASWMATFLLSFLSMIAITHFRKNRARLANDDTLPRPPMAISPRTSLKLCLASVSTTSGHVETTMEKNVEKNIGTEATNRRTLSQRTSMDYFPPARDDGAAQGAKLIDQYPIFLSFFCILAIGTPIKAATGDSQVIDGCTLWFTWITSIRVQRLFKQSGLCIGHLRLKNAIATLMNPVLMTTLLITAYTRAKAIAIAGSDIITVLAEFSRGSPLYAIWTSSVRNTDLPGNPGRYFGAGDAALSILETGILIWGFKLYECRRQLYGTAGLLTVIVSIAAAAGNVFLCVACGHLIGLEASESLAFAARSTTLALAKPAIEAVGGNMVVNAALVVSNGILGQLLYPFALGAMGVKREKGSAAAFATPSSESHDDQQTRAKHEGQRADAAKDEYDDPMTIAAGIAIGINGAAMGVAYLYETKSRAAPYASLAMTVFGVMTVVFTTVEPFKAMLVSLANV